MDSYAFAKSSQITGRSFLPSFASRSSCVMVLVCSMQPENTGISPVNISIAFQERCQPFCRDGNGGSDLRLNDGYGVVG